MRKKFFPSPKPSPLFKKSKIFFVSCSITAHQSERDRYKYLSHPNSQSELFTFAEWQTLHIATQFLTTDKIRLFTSQHPLPFSKKAGYVTASILRLIKIRSDIAPLSTSFYKAKPREWTCVLDRGWVRSKGSREQKRPPSGGINHYLTPVARSA